MDPRKKAALREAVHELLSRIIPVVREGGSVPLRPIAEAIGGEKLGSDVRQALDARGSMTFTPESAGKARFDNLGQALDLGLKAIKLKVPKRLSGWAEVLDGDEGVVLHFDERHTLSACKMLVCAGIEALELTKKRIFVDLEGKAFDRSYDLGGEEGGRGATALGREREPPSGEKVAGRGARQPPEAPRAEGKAPEAPKKVRKATEAPKEARKAPEAPKEARKAPEAPKEARKAPEAPKEARKAPETPRRVVKASARRDEQAPAGAKSALRGAVQDAKRNIQSGVGKTLRSAAESQWAAKQAVHKAGRDAKTNIQSGVRQTRKSAAESRTEAKEAGRKAREAARGQLEHSRETLRSRAPAARPKRGEAPGGGYLGLTTYPVRLPAKLADEQGATGGLIVLGVQPGGPADEAGLLLGDTLLSLDGRPMRKPGDLKQQLARERVGQRLDALVLRAGKTRHVAVEVGAH